MAVSDGRAHARPAQLEAPARPFAQRGLAFNTGAHPKNRESLVCSTHTNKLYDTQGSGRDRSFVPWDPIARGEARIVTSFFPLKGGRDSRFFGWVQGLIVRPLGRGAGVGSAYGVKGLRDSAAIRSNQSQEKAQQQKTYPTPYPIRSSNWGIDKAINPHRPSSPETNRIEFAPCKSVVGPALGQRHVERHMGR